MTNQTRKHDWTLHRRDQFVSKQAVPVQTEAAAKPDSSTAETGCGSFSDIVRNYAVEPVPEVSSGQQASKTEKIPLGVIIHIISFAVASIFALSIAGDFSGFASVLATIFGIAGLIYVGILGFGIYALKSNSTAQQSQEAHKAESTTPAQGKESSISEVFTRILRQIKEGVAEIFAHIKGKVKIESTPDGSQPQTQQNAAHQKLPVKYYTLTAGCFAWAILQFVFSRGSIWAILSAIVFMAIGLYGVHVISENSKKK